MAGHIAVAQDRDPQQRRDTDNQEEQEGPRRSRRGSGILDDSTKLVYGPTTTKYTYLANIKYNQTKFNTIDTILTDVERFTVRDRSGNTYQDLGNNGTAMWSTFYELPQNIGLQSGYNAYDPYVKNPEDFRYYDTKSPFIDLYAGLGGTGRSIVDFNFARNVKPHWNVGFGIQRLTSDKQIGPLQNEGDRNAVSSTLNFFNYYHSQDNKYTLIANIMYFDHEVIETGGVEVGEDTTRNALFQYEDAILKLYNANSSDLRMQIHQYQEYKNSEFMEFYWETLYKRQTNEYTDFPLSETPDYYDVFLISEDSTQEKSEFRELKNEIGIKGTISKFFYNLYVKRRDIAFNYRFLRPQGGPVSENYGGVRLRFDLDERNNLDGHFEYLQGGNYRFIGILNNPLFEVSYQSSRYVPTFLQSDYFGNHYEWHNDFQSTFANQINGRLKLNFDFGTIQPKISLSTIDNYVYFGLDRIPAQATDGLLISSYGADVHVHLNNTVHLTVDARYTVVGGEAKSLYRVPELFMNGKLYYEGKWFNNFMPVQVGINFYQRSAYFANDYDPITQQFFLQDDYLLENYLAADLFFNLRVDKVRIFAKMTHINQPGNDGYQVTPFYPGQPSVFDLGIRWLFFD
ncbi:MAG: putative porin [Bacteroidota bacterium]